MTRGVPEREEVSEERATERKAANVPSLVSVETERRLRLRWSPWRRRSQQQESDVGSRSRSEVKSRLIGLAKALCVRMIILCYSAKPILGPRDT